MELGLRGILSNQISKWLLQPGHLCAGTVSDPRPELGIGSLEKALDPSCSSLQLVLSRRSSENRRAPSVVGSWCVTEVRDGGCRTSAIGSVLSYSSNFDFGTLVVHWQYLWVHAEYPVLISGQCMCLPLTLP